MKKANVQIGVGELVKIKSTCKRYALTSEYIENTIKGHIAGVFGKNEVLEAVAALREPMMVGRSIYVRVGVACVRFEDSIREDSPTKNLMVT